ncbi:DUF5320 domain-containing protein [Salidesulfovibrio onnuriiensis]|uniref:DUF5320 domain-containing protein n=1 Tax=Salidesulfovibrio onnuriiensis TaxID=2583823 RepID=UPI0011CC2F46|nr:DUF5320 domain-containing protein [Salidesulfovibrio onnuriiensis]
MPGRDGTGPMGMGSRTGRGLGVCTGANAPRRGRWVGAGFGMGYRGYRWQGNVPAYAPAAPNDRQALEERAALLEAELKDLQQRIAELEQEE